MAEKRRLPVLQNTDDEVAHRPAWQGAAIVASLSVLLWVVVFALVSILFRHWAAPLAVVVVLNLAASAIACAGATAIARVAVPSMRARLAAIGGATGTAFVFVVAVAQTLRAGGGASALAPIAAAFALLCVSNGTAAFAFARLLERRAARALVKK